MKKAWTQPGISGTPIVCDGKLIIQGQWGDLRVVEASAEGYKEVANAKVFSPRSGDPKNPFGRASFSTPILLNGRIYCRFFTGETVCLDVSKDYPNPDQNVGKRRVVGEVCTVTGTLGKKGADKADYVVGLLTEDPQGSKQRDNPKAYILCARQHNDNPGALEKIAALVAGNAHVSVTGTLMYDDQLSVNMIEVVDKRGEASKGP
jgi:outer membrane protein assembly factor BamB